VISTITEASSTLPAMAGCGSLTSPALAGIPLWMVRGPGIQALVIRGFLDISGDGHRITAVRGSFSNHSDGPGNQVDAEVGMAFHVS